MVSNSAYVTAANRPRKGRFLRLSVATSSVATGLLSSKSANILPIIEYPKCGGTWLASMLACYLDLPFPRQNLLPVAFPAVVHGHWPCNILGPKSGVLLVRDGRDVAISYLHHLIRNAKENNEAKGYWAKKLEKEMGARFWEREFEDALDSWLKLQLDDESSRTWHGFVSSWLERARTSNDVVICRYEDLLSNIELEMRRVIEALGYDICEERLVIAIKRFDFKMITGRTRGDADTSSFARSATPGEWGAYSEIFRESKYLDAVNGLCSELGYGHA